MQTTMVTDQHAQSNSFVRALAVYSLRRVLGAQWLSGSRFTSSLRRGP